MNELILKEEMTSLEILEQINFFREKEENKTILNHGDFLKVVRNEFEEEISQGKISIREYENRGRKYPMFILSLKQARQVLLRESRTVRKAVIQYIENLEIQNLELKTLILKEQLNKQNEQWLEVRKQSKELRLETTDIIKEFTLYAKNQGSKNFDKYYHHYTMATYSALELIQLKKPKLRDTLDLIQLNQLSLAENLCRKQIKKYMEENHYYKDIYKFVKKDLENFAKALMIGN